jgi:hypothetical protein
MVYPGIGIPCSTGSAWCSSYSTSGTGGTVALTTNPVITGPSLGAGNSPVTETWVVGATSVTQYTLVQTDSSIPTKIVPATTGVYGVAMSSQSSSSNVEIARFGTVNCVVDTNSPGNQSVPGDLVVIGTANATHCLDSGQTSSSAISISQRIIGVFRSQASGGSTALVELTPAHYGTQITPGTLNSTGVTGSISTATLVTPTTGMYTFSYSYYVNQNGLCASSSDQLTLTFNWTDAANNRTLTTTALSLTTAQSTTGNYISGLLPIWLASGSFTYSSTLVGSCSGASYDVHLALSWLHS